MSTPTNPQREHPSTYFVHVSDDYDALYQQAMYDMQQPEFQGEWHIYTIWGIK